MKLVIAEKPQLAQVISDALGIVARKDGYFECQNDYVVTYAVGHILGLQMPEEINESYKEWKIDDLPLKVRPIPMKILPRSAKQFKIIESLLRKADLVINAGDPDDEGQLLIDEILDFCRYKGDVQRVLIDDLNKEVARKAFSKLKPNSQFLGMKNKALARSQADYIFGMNLSRAYTLFAKAKGTNAKLTIGRVQTPTLGLIVRRYLENTNHKEQFYYNLSGEFSFNQTTQGLKAKLQLTDSIPNEEGRIIDKDLANQIQSACTQKPCEVIYSNVERKDIPAPLPFSLLDLQVRLNNKYGYTSDEVLRITQDLREKYHAITYNRSDCRYLNSEQFENAPGTLEFLQKIYSDLTFNVDSSKRSRAFNDNNTTAHTAIIPVPAKFNLDDFSVKEKNVYTEIANQYLIQFMPEKQIEIATVELQCEAYRFKATATKTISNGWASLVTDEQEKESSEDADNSPLAFEIISKLKSTDKGECTNIQVKQEKTKPKPLYTEATLLTDLQNVAKYVKDPDIRSLLIEKDKGKKGENGGIGTPATRSAIIKLLYERGYFEYKGKKLIPTPLAIEFVNGLPDILTYPDMTALWFEQQREIEKGSLSVNAFLDGIDHFVAEQINQAEKVKVELKGEPCECGKGVLILKQGSNGSFFACSNYPTCKITKPALNGSMMPSCPCCSGTLKGNSAVIECGNCGLKVWRKLMNKTLTESQLLALLTKGKTPLIKGLLSKSGKEFEAYGKLNKAEKKIELEFPQRK